LERSRGRGYFSVPEFLDYKEQNHVFERVVGDTGEDVLYTSGDGMERFQGTNVTSNVFDFLGMPALLGRGITPMTASRALRRSSL